VYTPYTPDVAADFKRIRKQDNCLKLIPSESSDFILLLWKYQIHYTTELVSLLYGIHGRIGPEDIDIKPDLKRQ
jgi:hypothetical protein